MKFFLNRFFWASLFFLVLFLLGVSFWLENVKDIQPCALCLLQRFVFIGLAFIFLLGSFFKHRLWQLFISLLSLIFTSFGIFLAGRQVWLQINPSAQTTDCGVSLSYLLKILPPGKALTQILYGSSECSRVAWHFLSFSLAEWSLLFFLLFFTLSIIHFSLNVSTKMKKSRK